MPTGHIPRTITVLARGEITRNCSPGDQVSITGIFLPTVYTGYRAIRAGLLTDTYLEAMHIEKAKKTYVEQVMTDAMRQQCEDFSLTSDVSCSTMVVLYEQRQSLLLCFLANERISQAFAFLK